MKLKVLLLLCLSFSLFGGCATWNSRDIEPSVIEIEKANRVRFYGPGEPVIFDRCKLLGEMKLNELEKGQPASLVAVRKYPKANYVVHINSRMDGGVDGEFEAGFYLALDCGIFK
jgi:hypothetical protein